MPTIIGQVVGNRRLATGGWQQAVGSRRLAAGGWQLAPRARYHRLVATIDVPALTRTRVAGAWAKRMPIEVHLEVTPANADGVVAGVVEVRRSVLPLGHGEVEDLVLEPEMRIPIGTWHTGYAVFVLAEQPVRVEVRVRWKFPVWLVGLFVAAVVLGLIVAALTAP